MMQFRPAKVAKRGIRRVLLLVLHLLITTVGFAANRLQRKTDRTGDVRRILVIRLDLLGDMVNSMTAVAALHDRFPDALIDMLTLPYTAAIPRQFAAVHQVYTLDTNMIRSPRTMLRLTSYRQILTTFRTLRHNRYDLCVSLFGLMGSLWAFLSGAPWRIGYRDEGYPFMFTDPVPGKRYQRRRHEVYWDLDLAAATGASPDWRYPTLSVPPKAAVRMASYLETHGVRTGDRLVGIHGGAINGSAKRWPVAHWAALADRLIDTFGIHVALTGSANERPIAEQIHRRMRGTPLVLAGETDIDELLAVLARCELVISGDSGPLHLAVALGRPTVSLYGPTDPAIYGPTPRPGQPAIVLRRGLACSPCYNLLATAECPYGQPVCMIDISVGEVFAAARSLLDTSSGTRMPTADADGSPTDDPLVHS